ncbi:MAG: hypothetical protein WC840_05910 [Candidatus Peribacteraceae bacterium]
MRFLVPLIIIGALLASQIAWAQGGQNSPPLKPCLTRVAERRARRFIARKKVPPCEIVKRGPSSSSSSLASAKPSGEAGSSFSSSSSSYDTLTDTTVRPQFLLLGETGPILAAAKVFLDDEALDVTSLAVNLTTEARSADALLFYDESKRFIGRARLDPSALTNRNYKLALTPGTLIIPRRQETHFAVRPSLLSRDQGGVGNQIIAVANIVFEGNGVWSSRKYIKSTSETFRPFLTARSTITKITNVLQTTDVLGAGPQRTLGSFIFEGRRSDPTAHIDILSLAFQIGQTGGVQLTNVRLKADGSDESQSCVTTASAITCTVPVSFGSLDDGPRTLTLIGDVFIAGTPRASLRLTLNDPGDLATPGSVTWSDGTSTFQWVALDSPLAAGTLWRQ